ncbi:MAG: iron ABC transporter permease [Marinifilaceae bacterium]|jgi:iron complex transport system permease protein|nr:iron ABC transporter permease [Marinifilaceae bacterium]
MLKQLDFKLTKKIVILFFLLLILFIMDLIFGSVSIKVNDLFNVFLGENTDVKYSYIILNFRIPKAITSLLVGSGLAVSGLLMQTLFRNPLAGPQVLGISSGASLGVGIVIMLSAIFPHTLNQMNLNSGSWTIVLAALCGSALVFLFISLASAKINDGVSLLIVGIMFGSIAGSIVHILQYFSNPEQIQKFVIWTFGSVSETRWDELKILGPIILIGLIISLSLAKSLNILLLGENYAKSSGLSVSKIRFGIIACTTLLAGSLTAFTGPIAFIGIAVPHIVRNIFKTANHNILIPMCILTGACIMLACDLVSQLPGSNNILPINAVTSLFGGPIVIWVIVQAKRLNY